jgi:hypothetical protein
MTTAVAEHNTHQNAISNKQANHQMAIAETSRERLHRSWSESVGENFSTRMIVRTHALDNSGFHICVCPGTSMSMLGILGSLRKDLDNFRHELQT